MQKEFSTTKRIGHCRNINRLFGVPQTREHLQGTPETIILRDQSGGSRTPPTVKVNFQSKKKLSPLKFDHIPNMVTENNQHFNILHSARTNLRGH